MPGPGDSRTSVARLAAAPGAYPQYQQGTPVRDPISADIVVGAAKATPAVVGAALSSASSWELADVAVLLTILYTASLLFTTVVKNWGDWMMWWRGRWADAKRLWAWLHR